MPLAVARSLVGARVEADLTSVSLSPGTGGVFDVRLNDVIIFSRKVESRFPESKELKQLVRDIVAPARDLGHSDAPKTP
jgi:selenoprotein W-related protein